MFINDIINTSWHKNVYTILAYLSYALFIITFTGIIYIKPEYLELLDTMLKYYVSIFLILAFNPWTRDSMNKESRKFSQQIAFSGGIFLLMTTTIVTVVKQYFPKYLGLDKFLDMANEFTREL